ncbi:hypothetical protein ABPG75_005936 [Micractinium tetrahymenae]
MDEFEQAVQTDMDMGGPGDPALRWAQETGFYSQPPAAALAAPVAAAAAPLAGGPWPLVDQRLMQPNPLQHLLQQVWSGVPPAAACAAALQQFEQRAAEKHAGALRASIAKVGLPAACLGHCL